MMKIYTADDFFEANEVEEMLLKKGISCERKNRSHMEVPGLMQKELYDIYVSEEMAESATEVIRGHRFSTGRRTPGRKRIYAWCMLIFLVLIFAFMIWQSF